MMVFLSLAFARPAVATDVIASVNATLAVGASRMDAHEVRMTVSDRPTFGAAVGAHFGATPLRPALLAGLDYSPDPRPFDMPGRETSPLAWTLGAGAGYSAALWDDYQVQIAGFAAIHRAVWYSVWTSPFWEFEAPPSNMIEYVVVPEISVLRRVCGEARCRWIGATVRTTQGLGSTSFGDRRDEFWIYSRYADVQLGLSVRLPAPSRITGP